MPGDTEPTIHDRYYFARDEVVRLTGELAAERSNATRWELMARQLVNDLGELAARASLAIRDRTAPTRVPGPGTTAAERGRSQR